MKRNDALLDRFTVCLDKGLRRRLDEIVGERGYPSRSRALSDFIRRAIVRKDWRRGKKCAAAISVAYKLSDSRPAQGIGALLASSAENVLSVQTNILPGGKALSTVSVTGKPGELERLADAMRALKGVTHGSFSIVAPL